METQPTHTDEPKMQRVLPAGIPGMFADDWSECINLIVCDKRTMQMHLLTTNDSCWNPDELRDLLHHAVDYMYPFNYELFTVDIATDARLPEFPKHHLLSTIVYAQAGGPPGSIDNKRWHIFCKKFELMCLAADVSVVVVDHADGDGEPVVPPVWTIRFMDHVDLAGS